MKRKYFSVFLLFFIYSLSYSQTGETIVVSNLFDSGTGSLADAINKANASTAASGTIVFRVPVNVNGAIIPPSHVFQKSMTLYITSPLPVLTKSNWRIMNYVSFDYYNFHPQFSGPPGISNIIIHGRNLPGPGLVITGSNSVCEIPSFNFTNFKPTKYTVTTTADDLSPGSLRDALKLAYTTSAKDTIAFNIPGQAPHIINLSTALPSLDKNIVIDGSTQPGYVEGKEIVVLNGTKEFSGFIINSSEVEIYGMTIKNFINGIECKGSSFSIPTFSFIKIGAKDKGNLIISNGSISSNFGYGILFRDARIWDISICNNFIGTNKLGDAGIGNRKGGISLSTSNCIISENVISGNGGDGISSAYSPGNYKVNFWMHKGRISGNKIGTNPAGTAAIPNKGSGISLANIEDVIIGGNFPSEKNIISGNKQDGIRLDASEGNILNRPKGYIHGYIYNNLIGTDSTGLNPIPNDGMGISNDDGHEYGVYYVGGPGKGNTIAFNKGGAISSGDVSIIRNNIIYNNTSGVISQSFSPPVINNRTAGGISGTAPDGTIVQLFYDNGYNKHPQGKTFISEAYPVSGSWTYTGPISDPCAVTAIAIDTVTKKSSSFSMASAYSLGADMLICTGDTLILDAKDGFVNYSWSTGATTRTIKVAEEGKYIVDVNNGCSYKDTIEVSLREKPIVSLGKDTTVCKGQSFILDAGNPGATYSWKRDNSLLNGIAQTYNASMEGLYIAKVSFDRCSNEDTIKVKILNPPFINLGADKFLCEVDSLILNINNPNSNYIWSTGDTLPSIKVKQTGTYWARVSNKCGPSSSDTIKVSFDKPPVINLGNDTILCTGQSLILQAGDPSRSYKWYNNSFYSTGNYSRTIFLSGKYFVATALGSCVSSDTILVTVKSKPTVDLGPDNYVCSGDSMVLDGGSNATYYQWSTGETTRHLTIKNGGQYRVKIFHNEQCFASDTISFVSSDCNSISGILYQDSELNCIKNSGEVGMAGKIIILKNLSNQHVYYAYTDADGKYAGNFPVGDYQVNPATHKSFASVCPATPYSITLNNSLPISGKDFGISFNSIQDLGISLGIPSMLRPETPTNFVIQYSNLGTITTSGRVVLVKDPFENILSAIPAYTEIRGDSLIWNFSDLAPDEQRTIMLEIIVPFHSSLIGKYLFNKALIDPLEGDLYPGNNSSSGQGLVRYAFDPNDKTSDKGMQGNITVNDSIFHYKIRFQNTGNDAAHTVVVKDTLAKVFDILSFEPGACSHSYKVSISGTGVVVWTFDNIMLPDSTTDLVGSNGFINYTIKLKPDLPTGTVISNNAAIYFDLAPPVITNTTKHTIVEEVMVQSIGFPTISDKEYLDSLVHLNVSVSSGLPLEFVWSGPVSFSNGKLLINGTGDVRIRAYQNGDNNFYPASFVDRIFTIHKSDQIISFDPIPDKSINDLSFLVNAQGGKSGNPVLFTVVSGPALIDGETVMITGSGTVVIEAAQAGNHNFKDAVVAQRSFIVSSLTSNYQPASSLDIKISPNPATDKAELVLSNNLDTNVKLVSNTGAVVHSSKLISGKGIIDVSMLEPGTYLMILDSDKVHLTQQLVITK